jgi:hypothetical protein
VDDDNRRTRAGAVNVVPATVMREGRPIESRQLSRFSAARA